MDFDKKIKKERNSNLMREREALFASLRSEFSTPLDVIVGYTEILLDELAFYRLEMYEDDLKKILQSGKLLQSRVDEVLSFGTIAGKTKVFNLKTFSSELQFNLLTPLNSVIGYCELLLDEEFSIEQEQLTHDIEKILLAAKLFISYIDEIDKLAQIKWKGSDLLAQFKKTNIIIHDVILSIPPLENKIIYEPTTPKGSILVVEDNEMARDLLMRRLKHFGFNATPCGDASKVLDEIEVGDFDLILLSIITSGISGFEVLKRIMGDSRYYYLPVIVISPLKEIDAVVRCLEMGADDYLLKPFNPVIFKARIEASIEKKILRDKEKLYLIQIQEAKKRSDDLLLSIVPSAIAERLKLGEQTIVERFPSVTAVFIDIVNFSNLADKLSPGKLIGMLNTIFSTMDELTDQFGLEKIKTIGDCYMAVAGAPINNQFHAEVVANFACEVLEKVNRMNETLHFPIQVRIGIHTGAVVGGIIGKKKFAYDLWGKTINLASRMESHGEPGRIHVSEATYQILKDRFEFEKRGTILVKGVGEMATYFLIKPHNG
ncbi:adenylate/guanylate cyclase domain-containing protein [Legionella parisiensis]|uniref:histidine kinase n=1 Tax=Legionella parisiensis TaxID=45071 RepID=A0A1E5JVS4_9GAMM|nr:adenylate/guanylate cyclase domain-containing protein [Legionella parisiensis]KTD43133.1 guanylate cyclase [Legionella parisiensis]OEH48575.1 Adenylate cyclase [Legionella parisiensis]STX77788.1 guanylate cyclase [Legionella parisiensis]